MQWCEIIPQEIKPSIAEIGELVALPLWESFVLYMEQTVKIEPKIEYSKCSMARGWNVKYKKSNRAVCTVYPNIGEFTCMIVIGSKEAMEAELVLSACTPYVQELYHSTKPFNGSRWLIIEVTSQAILEDVKTLLQVRMNPKK